MRSLKVDFATGAAVGVVIVVLAAIVFAPAGLIRQGLLRAPVAIDYDSIDGTVWSGVIRDAAFKGVYLGDIAFKTKATALVRGKLELVLSADGQYLDGDAVARYDANGDFHIEDADLKINLTSAARDYDLLDAPIAGHARLRLAELVFSKSGCSKATGEVWTDVLHGTAKIYETSAFDMNGRISCRSGDIKLVASGSGDEGSAALRVSLRPNMTYVMHANVLPNRYQMDAALRRYGFDDGVAGLTYRSTGILAGL